MKDAAQEDALVSRLVSRRSRGEPLQYILGSQPFGALDIRCRRGVLVPRAETEAHALFLGQVVLGHGGSVTERKVVAEDDPQGLSSSGPGPTPGQLTMVDLCTGTGCIPLSLASQARHRRVALRALGVDLSPAAVALARDNLSCIQQSSHATATPFPTADLDVTFSRQDVFAPDFAPQLKSWIGRRPLDLLTANPPYVSARDWDTTTSRSVRNWEPRAALVPERRWRGDQDVLEEDAFYSRVLELAMELRPNRIWFEVGDLSQAKRVVDLALRILGPSAADSRDFGVEIWRDWPTDKPDELEEQTCMVGDREITIRGSGHGRGVYIQNTEHK